MKKCTYYNDHVTCASLMLDDFSLTAISVNDKIYPWTDWGYGLENKHSLYTYLDNSLLKKYPEIKGTLFIPIKKHGFMNSSGGYKVLAREIDEKLRTFILHLDQRFDLAFHGTTHGKFVNNQSGYSKKWIQEFEYLTPDNVKQIKEDIKYAENILEIKLSGGKYPGYKKNKHSLQILNELGFKWWCSDSHMMNQKKSKNKHTYIGDKQNIVDIPTNLSGNIFNINLYNSSSIRNRLRTLIRLWNHSRSEKFIQYLYDNQYIISIQEHYNCLRTDGIRQPINVFDDINSLDKIFTILRGADIWYAACSEIAHYLESYDFTKIEKKKEKMYEIIYQGRWPKPFLSVSSKSKEIKNLKTGKITKGQFKKNRWIFNNIDSGLYEEL